ncbi:7323_t:CDS:1, partial [Funneliformis geosporum]
MNAETQSLTFPIISEQHQHIYFKYLGINENMDVLFNKFPEYKKQINEEFRGSGLQGIFDKLVMMSVK